MTDTGDDISTVYTEELIALSEQVPPARLPAPDISAKAVSAVCGSAVTVECMLNGDVITGISFDIHGCALMRAVAAVMATVAPGKTGAEVIAAGRAVQSMLEGGGDMPSGDWEKLRILAPVRDYPSRHNTVMLSFDAVAKAFEGRAG